MTNKTMKYSIQQETANRWKTVRWGFSHEINACNVANELFKEENLSTRVMASDERRVWHRYPSRRNIG